MTKWFLGGHEYAISAMAAENFYEATRAMPGFTVGKAAVGYRDMPQLLMKKTQMDTASAATVDDKVAVGYRDEASSSETTKKHMRMLPGIGGG